MSDPQEPTLATGPGPVSSNDSDEAFCSACGGSYPLDLDTCPNDGARLAKLKAQPDALLGRVFEQRYEIRMALGQGGMGTVYRGWQISVDREVAIKVIHPKLASDRLAVKRFLREARLSSRLSQPNVVNVYDFGQTDDGILYIVMELLRGHTLAHELESQQPLALKRSVTIALQLCDALDAAHRQGIIHRDLKPGNIVILDDPPGRDLIKVLDFGLAKTLIADTSSIMTQTNAILGTPLYMAPEQIESKPSDQRADLYALGCMLYQMVTGLPPFTSDNVAQLLARHLNDEPDALPIGVPPLLATTIARLMEKDPAKRTASAAAVRSTLQTVLESGSSTAELSTPTPEIPGMRERMRHTPVALAVTAVQDSDHEPVAAQTDWLDEELPRRGRWRLLMVALLALGALAGAVFMVTRTRGVKHAGVPDAAMLAVPDGDLATRASVVDAAKPDATQVTSPSDAGIKRVPPKPPRKLDAGDDLKFQTPKD